MHTSARARQIDSYPAAFLGGWYAFAHEEELRPGQVLSFDIDGDNATGFCNLIYFSLKDGKTELAAVGGYNDKLRKENGEWRFSYRKVHIDH